MQSAEVLQTRADDQPQAWPIVVASATGLFFHFGSLLVNSFGVFLTPLTEQFNWSRTQVSLAFTLAALTAMLTMPLTGNLTDRFGARRLILICTATFGALFVSLFWLTPRLWHFYAVFIALGLVGPGTSAVPHASLISRWFTQRRGLALGFVMCGTAIGGVIWPSATQVLIERTGWRLAYALLGAGVLLIAMPILLLLLRDAPAPLSSSSQNAATQNVAGLSRSEALRSGVLWLLIIVFFLVLASIQACMLHLIPLLRDRGMTPTNAALASSLLGVAGMIGRFGTGWLLDLIPAVRVPMLAFSIVALGILLLFLGAVGTGAYIAALLIGFGYGAESATVPYLVSRYFGLRSFGEIYSYIFIAVPLGGALGPALMGYGYDRTGSYQLTLAICCGVTLLAAGLMMRLSAYPTFVEQNLQKIDL